MTTLVTFDGTGLSAAHALVAGDAGTGDTSITTVPGDSPTISTSDVPVGGTGETSITCVNAGTGHPAYINFNLASTQTQGRIRFYFKTPSSWAASALNSSGVGFYTALGANRVVATAIAGTGNPGALRAIVGGSSTTALATPNSTLANSTWYRCELAITISSSTSVSVTMTLWNMAGTQLYTGTGTGNPGSATYKSIQAGETGGTPIFTMGVAHVLTTDDPSTVIGTWSAPSPPTAVVYAKVSGAAKAEVATYVKVSGVAKAVTAKYVKIGGVLKTVE